MLAEDIQTNANNRTLLNGVVLPVLLCPSSPMPALTALDSTTNILNASYTGISGSSVSPNVIYWNSAYYYPGYAASHGVLIAQIAERRLDCQDALWHGEKRFDVFIGQKNHGARVLFV